MAGDLDTLRVSGIAGGYPVEPDLTSKVRGAVGAKSRAKKRRRQLTRAQGEQAGRKAAEIMREEPESLTAKGKAQKRKQAFAVAVSKLFGRKK